MGNGTFVFPIWNPVFPCCGAWAGGSSANSSCRAPGAATSLDSAGGAERLPPLHLPLPWPCSPAREAWQQPQVTA